MACRRPCGSTEGTGVAKQKPRQGDGARLVRLSDGACRRGAKSSAASRHPNAEPHRWLHGGTHRKAPQRSVPTNYRRCCSALHCCAALAHSNANSANFSRRSRSAACSPMLLLSCANHSNTLAMSIGPSCELSGGYGTGCSLGCAKGIISCLHVGLSPPFRKLRLQSERNSPSISRSLK